jgi:hypothetical protein
MAHAQKPDFVFRRNGRVHLNRQGRQFSQLLAAGACASAVVMLDTPCSEAVCRVLATHSIRQFPPHFPSRASPSAIMFQLDSTLQSVGVRKLVECIAKAETNPALSAFLKFLPRFELSVVDSETASFPIVACVTLIVWRLA